jgi:Domain of Unknown Function (DUF1080)
MQIRSIQQGQSMSHHGRLLAFTLAVFLVAHTCAAGPAATSWRRLFNDKNLDGWDTFMSTPDASWDVPGMQRNGAGKYVEFIGVNRDPLGVFKVENLDGGPVIHISGQGFGVMTTRESFADYHLRLQVRWGESKWGIKLDKPRDSGLLYFVHGAPGFDHDTWPRSIEFQIQERDFGDVYALGAQISVPAQMQSEPGAPPTWIYAPHAEPMLIVQRPPVGNRCRRNMDLEKPHGEWNTLDLIVLGDQSIHIVNGAVVMRLAHAARLDRGAPTPITRGQISLQTEGAEVYYRNIEIRSISTIPSEYR